MLVQWCWRRPAAPAWYRRAASWAHGGLDGFNGTWGSRQWQSGCCSISDGTVAHVGICCYWKRHEMEGPTDLGEWSLDSILTWLKPFGKNRFYLWNHSINAKKERITIMVGGGTYFQIFILIYALFFVQI